MANHTLAHRQTVINRPAGMQRRHFELIAEVIAKELEGEYIERRQRMRSLTSYPQ
jgi:hypothetical protein